MLTLKQKIDRVQSEIYSRENLVNILKKQLQGLEDSRAYCVHEWDSGVKGWEHEGCACIKCGINDQYARTLLEIVEARKKS